MADVQIEIERVVRKTDKSTLIETEDGTMVWLPTSEIEIDGDTMSLPDWLAKNEGLIEDRDKKDCV